MAQYSNELKIPKERGNKKRIRKQNKNKDDNRFKRRGYIFIWK